MGGAHELVGPARGFARVGGVGGLRAGGRVVRRRPPPDLGTDPGLFGTLLRFTLFAGLTAIEAEAAALRAGAAWDRGYCPTCGQAPLLARRYDTRGDPGVIGRELLS